MKMVLGLLQPDHGEIRVCNESVCFGQTKTNQYIGYLSDVPALDPVGRKEILDILRKISGTTTVLFSTHILSDVERICDHVAFLNKGKIAVCGTLAEIKALHGHAVLFQIAQVPPP